MFPSDASDPRAVHASLAPALSIRRSRTVGALCVGIFQVLAARLQQQGDLRYVQRRPRLGRQLRGVRVELDFAHGSEERGFRTAERAAGHRPAGGVLLGCEGVVHSDLGVRGRAPQAECLAHARRSSGGRPLVDPRRCRARRHIAAGARLHGSCSIVVLIAIDSRAARCWLGCASWACVICTQQAEAAVVSKDTSEDLEDHAGPGAKAAAPTDGGAISSMIYRW